MRVRGFLLGGTAGRTTLNGEGLQHEDGHSHLLALDDPELRLLRPDLRLRGRGDHPGRPAADVSTEQEDVFYYLTLMNENYAHPAMPEGASEGILQGHVPAAATARRRRRAAGAADGLRHDPARGASPAPRPARGGLRRGAPTCGASRASPSCARDGHGGRALEPPAPERGAAPCRTSSSGSTGTTGPVVAATDYMQAFADQIRPFVRRAATRVLGTDGFGRSDYRDDAALVLRGRPPPRRGAGRADRRWPKRRAQIDAERARKTAIEPLRDRPRAARAVAR